MKDYQVTRFNLQQLMAELDAELDDTAILLVTTQEPSIGKWTMTKLWRMWMASTAEFMAGNGVTMPLMIAEDGKHFGTRPFNQDDAHELFGNKWLGTDADGTRLSWSRAGRDGMRPATKGERYHAMQQHEAWASDRGITLFKPRGSEYNEVELETAA